MTHRTVLFTSTRATETSMRNYSSPVSGSAFQAPGSSADVRAQIKLWLRTIDALLVAIEETAFQVRELGETALTAVQALPGFGGGGESSGRGGVSPIKAFTNELSAWP